jgi:hypothetical protein
MHHVRMLRLMRRKGWDEHMLGSIRRWTSNTHTHAYSQGSCTSISGHTIRRRSTRMESPRFIVRLAKKKEKEARGQCHELQAKKANQSSTYIYLAELIVGLAVNVRSQIGRSSGTYGGASRSTDSANLPRLSSSATNAY